MFIFKNKTVGAQILKKNKNSFVMPAAEYQHLILRKFKLQIKKKIEFFNKKYAIKRPQDLTKSYLDDGQFYWRSINIRLGKKQILTNSISF